MSGVALKQIIEKHLKLLEKSRIAFVHSYSITVYESYCYVEARIGYSSISCDIYDEASIFRKLR